MPVIQLQFRRGNASNWTSANTLLAEGEMGIELDTKLFKIGDGVHNWTDLSYGGLTGTVGNVVSFDTSFNANVFVGGDVSLNRKTFIGVPMPSLLYDFENNSYNLGDAGSAFDMTLFGNPIYSSDAKYRSKSVYFNGTNQYASVSGFQCTSTGISFAFWFKLTDVSIERKFFTLYTNSGDMLQVSAVSNIIYLKINGNNSSYITFVPAGGLTNNIWYYFNATVTSAGIVNYGINGALTNTANLSGLYPTNANKTIFIAANETQSAYTSMFFDQFVLVNGILTGAQLLSLYNQNFYIYSNPIYSTSMSSGALVVSGGAGVRGNLNVGRNIVVGAETASTSAVTGALVVSGGAGITGNLYVGESTPSTSTSTGALVVSGGAGFTGNLFAGGIVNATSFNATSDYRIKTDIADVSLGLIDLLRPVSYYNTLLNKRDIGFIAHEVQEVLPSLVNGLKDGSDMQSLNYISIIGLLVKEVQELKRIIGSK